MRTFLVLLALVAALAYAVNAGHWGIAFALGASLALFALAAS
jgi:hypothetical protein